jgi:hypothetical protein
MVFSQRLYRNRNGEADLKLKPWVSMGLQSIFKLVTLIVCMPLFSEMSCKICANEVLSDPKKNFQVV